MHFYTVFFTNVSILITFTYLFNLTYKYLFLHASYRVKATAVTVIFILSGWLTMMFGIRFHGTALFDLRVVPLIFGTLVFRDPRQIALVGIGIAFARFAVTGITATAVGGFLVYLILTAGATLLVMLYQRKPWGYRRRAVLSILALNSLQVAGILLVNSIPRAIYLEHVVGYTYPLGLLMSSFFVFIIRDFYKEQMRVDELHNMNLILRRQTRELREAKRELEEKARQLLLASRYKSEFMANMSHELKTPLNSIILLSQMIRDSEEEGQREDDLRYAEIIHNSGNELLQMINDILDLSKVEAGKMDIARETVSVEEITQLLHHQLQPLAERKGLAFAVEMDRDVPATILSDGLRLSQILRNLLMNAVKFTDRGSVEMRVSVETLLPAAGEPPRQASPPKAGRRSGGTARSWRMPSSAAARRGLKLRAVPAEPREWLIFAVRDTGIGIEPDKQQLIFEAFQQEDGAINRKYGGTGLGLSISLQLARLLGGTLTLSSVKGEGSEFALRLPVRSAGLPEDGTDADGYDASGGWRPRERGETGI